MTDLQIVNISEIPEIQKVEPATAQAVQGQFAVFFDHIKALSEATAGVKVISADDKNGMATARALRLAIGKTRREADEVRVRLKADSLAYGKLVQSIYNIIEIHAKKAESYLQEQEDFALLQEIRRKAELKAKRDAELSAFSEFVPFGIDTGNLMEEDFQKLIAGVKLQMQHKVEAEEKAKEGVRILAEKKAEEDRKTREENERLKKVEQENAKKLEVERQARLKVEQELADKKRIEEDSERQNKALELEKKKAERTKKYKTWLEQNNYNKATDRVLTEDGVYKIFRLISTFND